MVERTYQANRTAIVKEVQDSRIALARAGIEIRRQGKPVGSADPRDGSVYLLVDCSSSMSGRKIVQARDGALSFAEESHAGGYAAGLITFSYSAVHLCQPRRDLSQVRRHLPSLEANGSTNMAEGIELATKNLRGKNAPLAIVVVTDGKPDDEDAALTAAGKAKELGIDIITVGTDDADQKFLEKLASRSGLVVMVKRESLGEGIISAASLLPGKTSRS